MRIEHIAMYVENLEDAKNFFIKSPIIIPFPRCFRPQN